jgi:hypothetical protein
MHPKARLNTFLQIPGLEIYRTIKIQYSGILLQKMDSFSFK